MLTGRLPTVKGMTPSARTVPVTQPRKLQIEHNLVYILRPTYLVHIMANPSKKGTTRVPYGVDLVHDSQRIAGVKPQLGRQLPVPSC